MTNEEDKVDWKKILSGKGAMGFKKFTCDFTEFFHDIGFSFGFRNVAHK